MAVELAMFGFGQRCPAISWSIAEIKKFFPTSLPMRWARLYAILMLLIIGTVRLESPNLAAALPAMRKMVEASRAEEGCVEYCYAEDVFDQCLIHIKELWSDQAALDRHFATDHIKEWRAAWPQLGIGNRHLRVYDVGEPRPT